jgi:hypothetical protein
VIAFDNHPGAHVDDPTNWLLCAVVKLKQLRETVPEEFLSVDPHNSSGDLPGTVVKVQRAASSPNTIVQFQMIQARYLRAFSVSVYAAPESSL